MSCSWFVSEDWFLLSFTVQWFVQPLQRQSAGQDVFGINKNKHTWITSIFFKVANETQGDTLKTQKWLKVSQKNREIEEVSQSKPVGGRECGGKTSLVMEQKKDKDNALKHGQTAALKGRVLTVESQGLVSRGEKRGKSTMNVRGQERGKEQQSKENQQPGNMESSKRKEGRASKFGVQSQSLCLRPQGRGRLIASTQKHLFRITTGETWIEAKPLEERSKRRQTDRGNGVSRQVTAKTGTSPLLDQN